MNATLFDQDIDLFAGVFHMGKVYEITNPKIKPVPKEIIKGGHKYQMIIRATTKVVEISSGFDNDETNIVPVNSMLQHVGETGRFAITAIVIAVRNPKKIPARNRPVEYNAHNLIVVDKNLEPATLTVWHDQLLQQAAYIEQLLASIPVIHVTRIRASTFAGGCWSTSTYSIIKINSDDPDVQELRHWADKNTSTIEKLRTHIAAAAERSSQENQISNEEEEITIPVKSITEQAEGKTMWIRGRITNVTNSRNFIYSACNVCTKRTTTTVGERFSCTEGSVPHEATSELRFNLHVAFTDESDMTNITLFDQLAEKILKKKANQIFHLSHDELNSFIDDFLHTVNDKLFAVKIVTYKIGGANKQLRWKPKVIEEVSS
ncbi:hypothetical protein RND81_12G039700 [Saponaria officinalis]|uniref:Replication factor A C-terminal domain-containing protein n=1 Tax=Saponaria officinalis TaxID=3572 RepID=A0AAW1H6A4_SAPOF